MTTTTAINPDELTPIWFDGFATGVATLALNASGRGTEYADSLADAMTAEIYEDFAAMAAVRNEVAGRLAGIDSEPYSVNVTPKVQLDRDAEPPVSSTPQLALLTHAGLQPIVEVDVSQDYQGDILAVVRELRWCGPEEAIYAASKFGFLAIGYGSCSGCDEWEAANGVADKLEIVLRCVNDVKWFDNLAALQKFVAGAPDGGESDHELRWYGHAKGFPEFQEKVAALADGQRFF